MDYRGLGDLLKQQDDVMIGDEKSKVDSESSSSSEDGDNGEDSSQDLGSMDKMGNGGGDQPPPEDIDVDVQPDDDL